jgi:hypothetical protein
MRPAGSASSQVLLRNSKSMSSAEFIEVLCSAEVPVVRVISYGMQQQFNGAIPLLRQLTCASTQPNSYMELDLAVVELPPKCLLAAGMKPAHCADAPLDTATIAVAQLVVDPVVSEPAASDSSVLNSGCDEGHTPPAGMRADGLGVPMKFSYNSLSLISGALSVEMYPQFGSCLGQEFSHGSFTFKLVRVVCASC